MKILILSQFSEIIENELPKCNSTIRYIHNVQDFDIFHYYAKFQFDILICFGYGRILPVTDPTFSQVRFINLHTSLLPYGRGLNPNFFSWLNNEPHGITIHEMDGSYDTGKIIYQEPLEINIEGESLRSTYYMKIFSAIKLLAKKWDDLIAGNYTTTEQPKVKIETKTATELNYYKSVLTDYNDRPLREFLADVKSDLIKPTPA